MAKQNVHFVCDQFINYTKFPAKFCLKAFTHIQNKQMTNENLKCLDVKCVDPNSSHWAGHNFVTETREKKRNIRKSGQDTQCRVLGIQSSNTASSVSGTVEALLQMMGDTLPYVVFKFVVCSSNHACR